MEKIEIGTGDEKLVLPSAEESEGPEANEVWAKWLDENLPKPEEFAKSLVAKLSPRELLVLGLWLTDGLEENEGGHAEMLDEAIFEKYPELWHEEVGPLNRMGG